MDHLNTGISGRKYQLSLRDPSVLYSEWEHGTQFTDWIPLRGNDSH